jgi:branched-chain amino acid aminotransferase
MQKGNMVWFDGAIIPGAEAQVSVFSHSLHYGCGAFEGIRAYEQNEDKGAIFRLKEHVKRLFETLHILLLSIPFSEEQIMQACIDVCKANGFKECYIRPLVFIGDGPLGVYPGDHPPVHVAIMAWKWGSYLGEKAAAKGARLKVSSFIRPHVNSLMTKGKITGQYINSVLAKTEAKMLGFDEALLLDEAGFLTEGSGENLFIVKDGHIKTTPLTSVLNGITRQTVLQLLKEHHYPVSEQKFTRDELWCADEIFLSGTAAEITHVSEVDFRAIGKNHAYPITTHMQSLFKEIVRGKKQITGSENWLTPIV